MFKLLDDIWAFIGYSFSFLITLVLVVASFYFYPNISAVVLTCLIFGLLSSFSKKHLDEITITLEKAVKRTGEIPLKTKTAQTLRNAILHKQ